MTADGLAGELPTGVILALCDRLLGEVGRRSHRFAWLRAPGAVADAWLPVEAYYPGHRLVVVCHRERTPYDHLFSELIPEHGLRLLQFAPADLGGQPGMAELKLSRMIEELPPPERPGAGVSRERRAAAPTRARRRVARARAEAAPDGLDAPVVRAGRAAVAADGAEAPEGGPEPPGATTSAGAREARARQAAARARQAAAPARGAGAPARTPERPRAARSPSVSVPSFAGIPDRRDRPRAPRPTRAPAVRTRSDAPAPAETVAVGVVAGLVLAAICGAELVAGVMAVTLSSGRVLLGLGIALDACARALGALDAGRAGKAGWAWSCAIIGSPAVVAAALSWRRGEIRIEAAPLAGLIAGLAIVFVVVGLVA